MLALETFASKLRQLASPNAKRWYRVLRVSTLLARDIA